MRLTCRAKVAFRADVELSIAEREPHAPARLQRSRLLKLYQPEDVALELACGCLAAHRRRDLDVIESDDQAASAAVRC